MVVCDNNRTALLFNKIINLDEEQITVSEQVLIEINRIYRERIILRNDPSDLSWLNHLVKYDMLEQGCVENVMYMTLLDGALSPSALETFLCPYFWGSSHGFNKKVLPKAVKAHSNERWRRYIKDIIREENTPSCHTTMLKNFVENIGFNVGDPPMIAQRFIDQQIAGYTSELGFALGYALGIEAEADFQIAVIHTALEKNFPQIICHDEFFKIHMSESGEEAHARATCEAIEFLVEDGSILPAEVVGGFRGAIRDTQEFFCEIHAELNSLVAETVTYEI
jgi:hypothetical protein